MKFNYDRIKEITKYVPVEKIVENDDMLIIKQDLRKEDNLKSNGIWIFTLVDGEKIKIDFLQVLIFTPKAVYNKDFIKLFNLDELENISKDEN